VIRQLVDQSTYYEFITAHIQRTEIYTQNRMNERRRRRRRRKMVVGQCKSKKKKGRGRVNDNLTHCMPMMVIPQAVSPN
jgi:hypothetical protein